MKEDIKDKQKPRQETEHVVGRIEALRDFVKISTSEGFEGSQIILSENQTNQDGGKMRTDQIRIVVLEPEGVDPERIGKAVIDLRMRLAIKPHKVIL